MRLIDLFESDGDRVCLTPGAIYQTHYSPNAIEIKVKLPKPIKILDVDDEIYDQTDDQIHDALEQIVSELIDEIDPHADEHWNQSKINDVNETVKTVTIVSATEKNGNINPRLAQKMVDPRGYLKKRK